MVQIVRVLVYIPVSTLCSLENILCRGKIQLATLTSSKCDSSSSWSVKCHIDGGFIADKLSAFKMTKF